MSQTANLVKAELRELDMSLDPPDEKSGGKKVEVQFNPESLKVAFSNQIQTPSGAGDQSGAASRQFVGKGTTKLTLQLWFDVNAPQAKTNERDVRKLTEKVTFFITPQPTSDPNKYLPPGVRFVWGSFQFDGLMESLEESLEFFSSDGIPLRASMNLSLSQQKIDKYVFRKNAAPKMPLPGTRPLTPAAQGSTLQGLADNAGIGANWQAIASINGIENPRALQPGQLLDLNVSASVGVQNGASVNLSTGVSVNAGISATASINASATTSFNR